MHFNQYPYVPQNFMTAADSDIRAELWRTRQVCAADNDPIASYYGNLAVQTELLIQENAAKRIANDMPHTYAGLQAAERIRGDVRCTKLIQANHLIPEAEVPVYLKLENEQHQQSFKVRGAANAIRSLDPEQLQYGVAAASAGNHAQGVARAARRAGVPAWIFMAETASALKIGQVRELGARVILGGENFDDAVLEYNAFLQANPEITGIPAFDDPAVVTGQSTINIEALAEQPEICEQFWAGGGGGLAAGNMAIGKEFNPSSHQSVVQLAGSQAIGRAWRTTQPTIETRPNPLSDGTAVRRPGNYTMPLIDRYADAVVTVSEAELACEIVQLQEVCGVSAEPAGALAVAGLRKQARQLTGPAMATVSGGNRSAATWQWASQTASHSNQRQLATARG